MSNTVLLDPHAECVTTNGRPLYSTKGVGGSWLRYNPGNSLAPPGLATVRTIVSGLVEKSVTCSDAYELCGSW